ncbi:regulator of protease activity HflC (stomatin/prohibitin superfamily) [Arcticibacter tournemirensis]|uniref:SPFH domain-containing protein n=1 Tax=Arcticibacter tournemirensis TaxID=699437 RepID=A0A4V1KIN2_9SPHI|nr:SPFH domain-containing protein [Arcticibacter tournemirensis]KAA8475711.1 SPFH domain-containing protein [Arcticibacter tournemirensis]RXF71282.1 SPFH domain-containing protein [Arcticibacter tournemirensis]TQM52306.1 regulator of protease activity HflC (stomatin/prohibitin superfamily) [Arcticibacter tournemirensis]
MKTEKIVPGLNGYLIISIFLFVALALSVFYYNRPEILVPVLVLLFLIVVTGLVIVTPNNAKVLLLFGNYKGSISQSGLFWVNPFYRRIGISLRARNFESEKIKVNDKLGNPILISVILVWKVKDTFKASFEVDNYENFIKVQTDSAVRKLAGSFPYDHFEDERATITLSTNFDDVNMALEQEIVDRMEMAGIDVIEARIAYLAYAPEIAHSMLRRQQASAIVAARHKIVEGAVGMVESALTLLSEKQIIELDEEKKAAMVSNLMVVLCGDRETQPVVNAGTLHQ